MKQRTITIVLVLGLLLTLMVWSMGSLAANGRRTRSANDSFQTNESRSVADGAGDEDDEYVDADLGKRASQIDRGEYLRLREEYIARKRGIEPGRPFDPSMRGRAIEQMERQEKGSRIESIVNGGFATLMGAEGAWTPIGPTIISNGQALSGGNTSVSGRVTAIVVDPGNTNNVYVGTAQGGVWRSLDGGTTWAAIADDAQSLAIGALALAPSDPTILYVGTGEFNGCGDCFFGVGLYRIESVNTSPTLIGPINPSQTIGNLTYNVFNGRGITKIVVDPTDPATIFVATGRGVAGSGTNSLGLVPNIATRGLYRSTNATSTAGSVTFQKLVVNTDSSADTPGTGNVDTTDIVMEPGVPNNLLVTLIGSATTGGIFRTTNALAATPTFTQVYAAAAGVRANLTINKVASVVTAYAATSETPNNTPGCTSSGTGAVRKQIDPFNSSSTWVTQLTGGGGFCGGQCFYNITIAINPSDANEVYLGGNARGSCSDGMKKSTNGGATFTRADTGLHADSHTLFYDTAGTTIFTGNDGGVWKRNSSAAPATGWTNLNNASLNTLQFGGIAVHPTDRNLMIGGTQDNGTEYQQTSVGNWSNAEGGDGGYCLIDQSATDTTNVNMYHTFYNLRGSQIGFDRIVNTNCLPIKNIWPTRGAFGGSNDPTIIPCDGTASYIQNGININDNVLFYAPMMLGPGAPNTVYFGTDRLYRSSDRGDSMFVVSQSPITGSPISTIAISPQDDHTRLVGLQNGQVWATSTGSTSLVNLTSASFPANPSGSTNKFVGRGIIDPTDRNVAYVAFSFFAPAGQGIWKITNLVAASGASPAAAVWTQAGNGIPSVPINALVIDPTDSNNVFAGTDIGVYNSTDGGATWNPFGTGLPRSAVFDLVIQPSFRILRAGTHGRGVWEISLKTNQTIEFGALSDKTFGDAPFTVGATASSGLPVSFQILSGPATITGDTVTITGAGTVTVRASQAGDSSFNAATPVDQSFTVAKANQTITVNTHAPASAVFNTSFSVAATSSSGLPVSFSSSGVCTNVGANFTMTSGTGTCTVKYDQAGNSNYNGAPQVTESVTAQKINQTITVNTHAPSSAVFNTSFSVASTSSSGLPVSFSSSGVCTNVGANFTMTSGTGTCTVKYDQAGNSNYNGAPQLTDSVTAQKTNQTITFGALSNKNFGDAAFTVSATASSGLPVSFQILSGPATITGDTVTITGIGTVTVRASQAGDSNFNAAIPADQSFSVAKGNQTITVNTHAPASAVFNTSFSVAATSSSGLPVTFSSSGVCTNVGANFTMTSGTGTCTVKYDQAGNSNYNGAPQVTESVTAQKTNQTITFGALSNKNFGDAAFTVSATASSGLPVSFQILSGPATISGNTVTITGAGTVTLRASQAGDSNFNAATPVDQPFTVAKANQTITFGALANKTFGDPDFAVSTSASSGLSVSFGASGNCTVTGTTVHLTGAGSCTITASQAGNTDFNAATNVPQSFNIAKAATTTTVSSSANPSGLSQSVTFTATVTSGAGTPTGAVQFKDNGTNLDPAQALNGSGVATFATSSLTAGTHTITADYSGDVNFVVSTGTLPGGQVVNNQSLISFSQSTYSVGESAGFLTITVNRSGDTTSAVTVDYATSDGAASLLPCAVVNGLASSRCDFNTALGTLKFAAGETSKTFVVLINQDSYVEVPETFAVTLSNLSGGAVLISPSAATVSIDDDISEPSTNPNDVPSDFVRQHYHDFLNREADQSGLNFWVGNFTPCGTNQQCIDVARINVSAAFFLSIEFQGTGYLIERLYKTSYGDAIGTSTVGGSHQLPVPIVRLNEFLHDSQQIGLGVIVGQPGWEQALENNKQAFTAEFVQRSRFTTAFPITMTPAQFVDTLNANAGNPLSPSERNQLVSDLTANVKTRAQVLRAVAEDPDLVTAEFNRAFVLMQFLGYLRRNPNDAPDTDYSGYDFWLTKLNQFNGNFQNAEMVKAFITSTEYRQRFGP